VTGGRRCSGGRPRWRIRGRVFGRRGAALEIGNFLSNFSSERGTWQKCFGSGLRGEVERGTWPKNFWLVVRCTVYRSWDSKFLINVLIICQKKFDLFTMCNIYTIHSWSFNNF
jgi:hypothetical protein